MRHELVKALGAARGSDEAADLAHLLLDQAHILDGEVPADPAAFARRLNAFVVRGLGKAS
jgi:molecular chaperone HtpG